MMTQQKTLTPHSSRVLLCMFPQVLQFSPTFQRYVNICISYSNAALDVNDE